jgi:exodeoxyribonuclease VII small subunit
MEKEQKITYAEALKRLESVLDKIENPDLPLSEVEDEVKKAIELIKLCKEELNGYEQDFNKLIKY